MKCKLAFFSFYTRYKHILPSSLRRYVKVMYLRARSSLLFVPRDELSKYDAHTIHNGHHLVKYRSISANKSPFDYVIYQMVISEIQPDLIIEIGTKYGGSAYYMADLLNNIGHGIVHTIDIVDDCNDLIKQHPRIKLYSGGWQNYDLDETRGYNKILIIDDSDHTYLNTLAILNKFHSLVTISSYFIVEDGIVSQLGLRYFYNGGPTKAIKEFLKYHDEFIIDKSLENFFGKNATFNVCGYLKKIK